MIFLLQVIIVSDIFVCILFAHHYNTVYLVIFARFYFSRNFGSRKIHEFKNLAKIIIMNATYHRNKKIANSRARKRVRKSQIPENLNTRKSPGLQYITPRYLTQWAAVRTQSVAMMLPPQMWFCPSSMEICQGQECSTAASPPTIRSNRGRMLGMPQTANKDT